MGAGALAKIPMHIDKATFRQLSGGTINDAIFDANCENGIMSRDRLIELSHMRDTFLSHDFGTDCYGRGIHQRVQAINAALKAKGLLTWMDEQLPRPDMIVTHVCKGIDRSRSMVLFLTKSYIDKVMANGPTDNCALEFTYTLSKKHPEFFIPVVFEEELLDQNRWPGAIGMGLGQSQVVNFIDDTNFDQKVDELFRRIVRISKTAETLSAENVSHNTLLTQTNKTKEEHQFFQWLARSTSIEEGRRMIYCVSMVRAGVNNVFTLSKMMNANPNFLISVGISEADADQIALAVRDLGLGYNPVREFKQSLTIESVVYALRKASQQAEDPTLAENALSCAARIAASNKIMPSIMCDAGIGDAVLKLMQRNLGHAPSMEHGCLTIYYMTINDPVVCEKMGVSNACDIIPRTIRSHATNLAVIHNGCLAIGALAANKENKQRFTYTGACDVVIKVVKNAMQSADVVEKCIFAANRLSDEHQENVSKLGVAGACEMVVLALQNHYTNTQVVNQVFRQYISLSVEPSNRTVLGGNEASCMSFTQALHAQVNYPEVMIIGCHAIADVIMGNAFNRQIFTKTGTCEAVRAVVLKYPIDLNVLAAASKAIFALSAGTLENKQKFAGIQPILQQAINANPSLPEQMKNDLKAAVSKI
ncbi:TIR domain-containing protein [archaeon]|nr:MAG: TIR domain-containing protein [archaeon]